MCPDEDWVKAAMTDETVVAELLLRLHHATPPKTASPPPALPLEWTVRQRRSRPMMLHGNKKPTQRASPTTPLSWSGATSFSGGGAAADASEESSRPPPNRLDAARSKVSATSGSTTNKRSRKKKSLAELQEEEILLLKERRNLKRELATLRVSLEKQRATNESLKRVKLDLESQPAVERVTTVTTEEAIPDQMQQKVASRDPIPSILPPDVRIDNDATPELATPNGSSKLQQEVMNQENKFVVPDLNLSVEEDSNPEVLYGVS